MRRLHGAVGKDSSLGAIGKAVDATPWYSERLCEYIEKSPILLEQGYKVLDYLTALQNLCLEVPNLKHIYDIAQNVPKLTLQLRVGSCVELMEKYSSAVLGLWQAAKEAPRVAQEQLEWLSKLLQEATTTFPLEPKFSVAVEECGKMLQRAGRAAQGDEYMKLCGKMLEIIDDEPQVLVETVKKTHALLSAIAWSRDNFSVEDLAQQLTLMQRLFGFLLSLLKDSVEFSKVADVVVEFVKLVQVHVENVPFGKVIAAVQSGCSMVQLFLTVQETMEEKALTEVHDVAFDQLQMLSRKQKRFLQAREQVVQPEPVPLLEELSGISKEIGTLVSEQQVLLLEASKRSLVTKQKDLCDIAAGQVGGMQWTQNFKDTTWEALVLYAEQTILKINLPDLQKRLSSLEEALLAQEEQQGGTEGETPWQA